MSCEFDEKHLKSRKRHVQMETNLQTAKKQTKAKGRVGRVDGVCVWLQVKTQIKSRDSAECGRAASSAQSFIESFLPCSCGEPNVCQFYDNDRCPTTQWHYLLLQCETEVSET